ncbi:hypothetical protein C8Q77DRAFT_780162 [Trametes polyzona]|nr:hypothetical protein C8Q77DRAFT_780162 [Trametes polyzona]
MWMTARQGMYLTATAYASTVIMFSRAEDTRKMEIWISSRALDIIAFGAPGQNAFHRDHRSNSTLHRRSRHCDRRVYWMAHGPLVERVTFAICAANSPFDVKIAWRGRSARLLVRFTSRSFASSSSERSPGIPSSTSSVVGAIRTAWICIAICWHAPILRCGQTRMDVRVLVGHDWSP